MPPAMSTLPLGSRVAVCESRGAASLPEVRLKVPVAGSYSSAESLTDVELCPPTIRTLPLGSKVAVWRWRSIDICPAAAVKLPAAGS